MDSRLLWLSLAAFVGSTEGGLISGLLPSISADLGVTMGQAGLVMVGYALAYAIGTPLFAVVLGGVGRRRVLAGAELGLAICALLMAVSAIFPLMVGVRTLLAICAGTFTGTAMATAAMIAPTGQRGRAIQIVTLGQSLAVLIGVPAGAYIAAHYNWRINYAAIAVMAGAASLALYLRLPRGMYGDTQSMRERIRVLANPGVVQALVTTLFFMTASYGVMIYVGALLGEIGLGLEVLPAVLLASGVGPVAASMSAGRIADRLGNRVTVILSTLLMTMMLGVFALLHFIPLEWRLAVLMIAFSVQGYIGWGYWIAHCSQMAHLAPSSVTVAISLDMAALNFGVALAAAAGGVIVDNWGAWALPYVGVPIGLAALAVWLAMPRPVAQPA